MPTCVWYMAYGQLSARISDLAFSRSVTELINRQMMYWLAAWPDLLAVGLLG